MSWSLQLQNGDLATDGAQFSTVTGKPKLIQDLRCQLLEALGTDNLHPEYGSNIDEIIGEDITFAAIEIEAELTRIIHEQQTVQLGRAKRDRLTLGRPTLELGEVIIDIIGINLTQTQDTVLASVVLTVGDDSQIQIDIPLEGTL